MELTYNSIKKKPPNMHLHANKGPYNKSKLQHRSVVGFQVGGFYLVTSRLANLVDTIYPSIDTI